MSKLSRVGVYDADQQALAFVAPDNVSTTEQEEAAAAFVANRRGRSGEGPERDLRIVTITERR
jgi:hypothetical protein